jgi:adenosyl cobinamide kinase/adenosyl cobinamide phosphate guanylyltransferase
MRKRKEEKETNTDGCNYKLTKLSALLLVGQEVGEGVPPFQEMLLRW